MRSNPRAVQISLSLAVFLVPFTGSSIDLAMPQIGGEFSMSAFSLAFMVSCYLAGLGSALYFSCTPTWARVN